MKFFTADIHFGHKNIIKYSNRPFKDIFEMRETIINNWNSVVNTTDEVYIIGDFSFAKPEETISILNRLNGNKFLVRGNHDNLESAEFKSKFSWIKDYYELNVDMGDTHKQKIVMCHYAMRVWNKSHIGAWNIYGHSHGTLPPEGKQIDVGVDAIRHYDEWYGINAGTEPFTPVSLDQIKLLMDTIEFVQVDHHGE